MPGIKNGVTNYSLSPRYHDHLRKRFHAASRDLKPLKGPCVAGTLLCWFRGDQRDTWVGICLESTPNLHFDGDDVSGVRGIGQRLVLSIGFAGKLRQLSHQHSWPGGIPSPFGGHSAEMSAVAVRQRFLSATVVGNQQRKDGQPRQRRCATSAQRAQSPPIRGVTSG